MSDFLFGSHGLRIVGHGLFQPSSSRNPCFARTQQPGGLTIRIGIWPRTHVSFPARAERDRPLTPSRLVNRFLPLA